MVLRQLSLDTACIGVDLYGHDRLNVAVRLDVLCPRLSRRLSVGIAPRSSAAFTIFVVVETWLVLSTDWFVDKYGPRVVVLFGGLLPRPRLGHQLSRHQPRRLLSRSRYRAVSASVPFTAPAWATPSNGSPIARPSCRYHGCGFGAGSTLTVHRSRMIGEKRLSRQAFFTSAWPGRHRHDLLLADGSAEARADACSVQNNNIVQSRRNFTPAEVLKQPIFWLMYFMFAASSAQADCRSPRTSSQSRRISRSTPYLSTLVGLTMTTVTFAATIDRILNGLTAPILRVDFRQDRPRKHDVYRVRHGGRRHLSALPLGQRSGVVRPPQRLRVPRLG